MSIAIVVLTYNRLHLLRQCVERVVAVTSDATGEVIIWNNGSSDGTREYLDTLDDPRIRAIHHDRNIGPSAYDIAFRQTGSEFLIELDDDIIDAPAGWDETLMRAFKRLPHLGLLSANLADNPHDVTARIMYGENAHLYRIAKVEGVELKLDGPVGGGCAITSRSVYDRVGGFGRHRRLAYWSSDASFMKKLGAAGLQGAYLNDLEVVHAGGTYYAPRAEEKDEFWRSYRRRARRRQRIKRLLLAVPYVDALNERHGWFVRPGLDYPFFDEPERRAQK